MTEQISVAPISVTLRKAAEVTGLSYATIYKHYRSGHFEVKFDGRKPLVSYASLMKWFESLPDEPPEVSA